MVLQEDKENAINIKQMDSVRQKTSLGTMKKACKTNTKKTLHQHRGRSASRQKNLRCPPTQVDVHRGKRTSEAGLHMGSSFDCRAETSFKVCAPKLLFDQKHSSRMSLL